MKQKAFVAYEIMYSHNTLTSFPVLNKEEKWVVHNNLRVQHSHPANCNHSYGTKRKQLHVCGYINTQTPENFSKQSMSIHLMKKQQSTENQDYKTEIF